MDAAPMTDDGLTQKGVRGLAAAAQRIGADQKATQQIDDNFEKGGNTLTGYIAVSGKAPAVAARDLVRVGQISPSDPCAVALQEDVPLASSSNFSARAAAQAGHIQKMSEARDVKMGAMALKKGLTEGTLSPEMAARGFERLAGAAKEDPNIARACAEGFAGSVVRMHADRIRNRTRGRDEAR